MDLYIERPTWKAGIKKSEHLNEDPRVDGVVRGRAADRGGDIVLRGAGQVVHTQRFDERKQGRGDQSSHRSPPPFLPLVGWLHNLMVKVISCQQDVL